MILVICIFFVFILLGLPIGVTLGVAGVVGLVQIGGENFLMMAPKRYFDGLDLFTFMAMPFFILAGEIMNRSGITQRLAAFADALVGYLRGGLARSNMIASVLFAGMTGAAVADIKKVTIWGNHSATQVPDFYQATIDGTPIECRASDSFTPWLAGAGGSLAITTYQAGKGALVGWNGQQVTLIMRHFPKPMGLAVPEAYSHR